MYADLEHVGRLRNAGDTPCPGVAAHAEHPEFRDSVTCSCGWNRELMAMIPASSAGLGRGDKFGKAGNDDSDVPWISSAVGLGRAPLGCFTRQMSCSIQRSSLVGHFTALIYLLPWDARQQYARRKRRAAPVLRPTRQSGSAAAMERPLADKTRAVLTDNCAGHGGVAAG